MLIGAVAIAASGLWRVIVGRTRQFPGVRPPLVRVEGLLRLALAPLPVLCGWVAVPIVERRNDWVDEDGDGMLDPFVNGQYDWMDRNLGDWFVTWALLSVVAAVVAVALLVMADRALMGGSLPSSGDHIAASTEPSALD